MRYFIEVDAPSVSPQRFEVSKGSGFIGSGESDVVYVAPSSGLLPSSIQIDVGEGGVMFDTQGKRPLTSDGKPCTSTFVKWGGEVYSDTVCFTMLVEGTDKKGTSVLVWVFVVLLALLGVGFTLEADADRKQEAPPLHFSFEHELTASSCPSAQPHDHARDLGSAAAAKMQRYPFVHEDGPEALRLLHQQKACLMEAGNEQLAAQVDQRLHRFATRLDDDFEQLEATLIIGLSDSHPKKAYSAAQALFSLTQRAQSKDAAAYRLWLGKVQKELQWRLSEK